MCRPPFGFCVEVAGCFGRRAYRTGPTADDDTVADPDDAIECCGLSSHSADAGGGS